MKGLRISILVVAAALMIMGVAGTTYAFHDGGVATCESCHTMHESLNGAVINISKFGTSLAPQNTTEFNDATRFLLKGGDQSSTCLNCHAAADSTSTSNSYHVMSSYAGNNAVPVERGPAGDFAWLTISGVSTAGKATNPGNHHGHNIVAIDFGLSSSTNYAANGGVSPGGSYPAANLYCNSCHNPHSDYRVSSTGTLEQRTLGSKVDPIIESGSYGNTGANALSAGQAMGVYRFLGGVGYLPKSVSTSAAAPFTANPPVAVSPSTYNQTESAATYASNYGVRVAYGSGMSEWCGNCHSGILNNAADPSSTHRHPAGAAALLNNAVGMEATNYNAYLGSGDLSGNSSSSYNSLVPYEEGLTLSSTNLTALSSHATNVAGAYGTGPNTGTENVMCVSCHRVHASAFPEMLRWDAQGGQFLTLGGLYIGTDNWSTGLLAYSGDSGRIANSLGYTTSQLQAAYYDRNPNTFGTFNRSYCNKCHAKD